MNSILTYQVCGILKTGKNKGDYKICYVEATDIQDAEIKGRIYCIKNKMKFVAVDFDDNDNEGLTY